MSERPRFALRDADPKDVTEITRIYARHVLRGLASFEDVPPDEDEMMRRYIDVVARGLPWLVACDDGGRVVGYAYAALYRLRSAYRYTVEDSIYIAPDALRRGIGRATLTALVERCAAMGFHQMVAVIGDSGNAPSIGLHESMGFSRVGLMPAVGFKFARWVDVVLMQRALGGGAATLP